MNAERIHDLASRFALLRERKRQAELAVQDLDDEMTQLGGELRRAMEAAEMTSVKLDGVGTVYLETKFYAREVKERHDELLSWLDERGLGALAPRTVHHQTLTRAVTEWMESDHEVPPGNLVVAHPETVVRLRAAKGPREDA